MYCKKCGNKMEDTMNFCPKCGDFVKVSQSVNAVKEPERKPTSIGMRILALIISIICISLLSDSWAKCEVGTWFYYDYKQGISIMDMAEFAQDAKRLFSFIGEEDEVALGVMAASLGAFISLITIFIQIGSGIAGLLNVESSGGIRRVASNFSIITIVLVQFTVWNVEHNSDQLIESTGVWFVLLIFTLIDKNVVAKSLGVKKKEQVCSHTASATTTHLTKYVDNGEWKCPDCGRTNAEYIQTCACGKGRA